MSLKFRRATANDAKFVWEIRNSLEVRLVSLSCTMIKLPDHIVWFKKNYKQYLIIKKGRARIGFFRVNDEGFVSFALKKQFRGKGLGQEILKRTAGKSIILMNNPQSVTCFVKAGYRIKGFYLEKDG